MLMIIIIEWTYMTHTYHSFNLSAEGIFKNTKVGETFKFMDSSSRPSSFYKGVISYKAWEQKYKTLNSLRCVN